MSSSLELTSKLPSGKIMGRLNSKSATSIKDLVVPKKFRSYIDTNLLEDVLKLSNRKRELISCFNRKL